MQNAKLFVRCNDMSRRHTELLLPEFLPRMRWTCEEEAGEKAAALDVGCGPGDLTAEILQPRLPPCVKALMGMDLSSAMVNYASSNHKNQHLRFVQGDIAARDLPATPLGTEATAIGGFCKIFSFYTLHWVQDQRTALGNIHWLLREGGEGLLCLMAHSAIFTAYEVLMRQPRWERYMTDAKTFSSPYQHSIDAASTFSSALQEAGFKVHYCHNHPINHQFRSMENFLGLVEAVNPFVQRVPKEDQDDFIEDTVRAVQKTVRQMPADGEDDINSNTYYYNALVAHVEKQKMSQTD